MCSQTDAPDQHDGPVYSTPRVYDLAGERPPTPEPRGSVALAVCGDFIERYEAHGQWIRATTVRRLRDAIAEAEAAVRA